MPASVSNSGVVPGVQPRSGGEVGTAKAAGSKETGAGAATSSDGGVLPPAAEGKSARGSDGISQYQAQQQFNVEARGLLDDIVITLERSVSNSGGSNAETTETTSEQTALERIEGILSGIRSDSILGQLFIQFAAMARDNALDTRLAARDQAQVEMKAAAQDVRDAADKAFSSALTQAIVGIVAAGVSILGSVVSVRDLLNTSSLTKMSRQFDDMAKHSSKAADAAEALGDTAKATQLRKMSEQFTNKSERAMELAKKSTQRAEVVHETGQTVKDVGNTTGKLVSAHIDQERADIEAGKLERDARAELERSNIDLTGNIQAELLEMIRSVLEFLKTMIATENEMQSNFTRLAG